MEENAAAIAAATGPGLVVEFGIGNARKVDPLLTALGSSVFAALDISLSALKEALSGLAARHPNTAMVGICWTTPTGAGIRPGRPTTHRPWATSPRGAVDFLRNARQLLVAGTCCWGWINPASRP